jgi:hypothetical protein
MSTSRLLLLSFERVVGLQQDGRRLAELPQVCWGPRRSAERQAAGQVSVPR